MRENRFQLIGDMKTGVQSRRTSAPGSVVDFFDAHAGDAFSTRLATRSGAVTDKESQNRIFWRRFNHLLHSPLSDRMIRHVELDNHAPLVALRLAITAPFLPRGKDQVRNP